MTRHWTKAVVAVLAIAAMFAIAYDPTAAQSKDHHGSKN